MSNGYLSVLFLSPLMVGAAGIFVYWYTGREDRVTRTMQANAGSRSKLD